MQADHAEFLIGIGKPEDGEKIEEFALALHEDGLLSRKKWIDIINQVNVLPLLATIGDRIIGKMQARIFERIGWVESIRVHPEYRRLGVASSLFNYSMDWMVQQGVRLIRIAVDSDNLTVRNTLERYGFSGDFTAISPSTIISEEDLDPDATSHFSYLLDLASVSTLLTRRILSSNIMVNGLYAPYSDTLMDGLIKRRHVLSDYEQHTLIIISEHALPSVYHAMVIADSREGYSMAARAVRAFSARAMAVEAVIHASASRNSVVGLVSAGFAWDQPHSVIIYKQHLD